jgi:hypothetical protein
VNTQLYWHTIAPSYAGLQIIPENRAYVSVYAVNAFITSFLAFSHGELISMMHMRLASKSGARLILIAESGCSRNLER